MDRYEFITQKIISFHEASQKSALWKMKGEKVVFTNGCFDLLHPGHVTYLAKAASLGNRLLVGLNSDDSVRRLNKDVNRPINSEESRALVIAGLGFVDSVVIFDESTPENLIHCVCPDVLVKGGDYDADELNENSKKHIVGSNFVKNYGGIVKTIDLVVGFSTTTLIEKMK